MKRLFTKTTLLIATFILALTAFTSCIFIIPTPDDPPCTHEYTTSSTPPTCTEGGRNDKVCRLCGDSKTTDAAPALGHSFEAWTVTVHPTATSAGVRERVCTRCGFTETDAIAPHEHDMMEEEGKAADCLSDGWDGYLRCRECDYNTKLIITAIGHAWGEYTSLGNGTHIRTCLNDSTHRDVAICTYTEEGGACTVCAAEYCFGVRLGNTSYGYYALGEYDSGEKMQKLYRDLTTTAEAFFYSDEDVAAEDGVYIIGSYDIVDYGLVLYEAKAVWKIFYISSPAYYWLDAAVVASDGTVYLTIADDYASADYRRICDVAISEMERECRELLTDGMSELEKSTTIAAYIIRGLEYAYESDGETPVSDMWAHSMAGFAMHGYGVCEVYSKSFMYLCMLNGVECICGSGYAGGEAHSWNYFRVDGVWYGADLTWTDHSGEEVFYDTFGLCADFLFANHTSHTSTQLGTNFIYETPELSDTNLELATLYKNDRYIGVFPSLDAALDAALAIRKEDEIGATPAILEIRIDCYSSYNHGITHSLDRAELTGGVTISGRSEYVGDGYVDNNSVIVLKQSVKLGSSLMLKDVYIQLSCGTETIDLSNCTLTLSGKSVYIEARLDGAKQHNGATVVASTARGVYLLGGASVYRVRVVTDKVVFGSDSSITYCTNTVIYATNGVDVKIMHYEGKY